LVDIGIIRINLQIILITCPVRGLVEAFVHNIDLRLIGGSITIIRIRRIDNEILYTISWGDRWYRRRITRSRGWFRGWYKARKPLK